MRIFCSHRQDDWASLLASAEFAYNNAANESTKLSPFFVEYGWNPRMAPDVHGDLTHPNLDEIFKDRKEAREQAQSALVLAADNAKWYFDEHKKEVPFKVGDFVLLKGKNLHAKVQTPKLAAKNYGPYEIIEQLGPLVFKLKLPRSMRIHPVFNARVLLPYHKDTISNRNPDRPPAVEVEGDYEFEVDEILDSRTY